ncbi:nuclear encoded CLP protease 5 [Perilla frutescens var. hirtella]|nr:nuclear encoded CLP protease 5 [Perilla frutescens var. hirtella]
MIMKLFLGPEVPYNIVFCKIIWPELIFSLQNPPLQVWNLQEIEEIESQELAGECCSCAGEELTTWHLVNSRIIICGGEVDDDMANIIVARFLYLDAVDPSKVFHIEYNRYSHACDFSGMAVFDTMRHIRPDVSTNGSFSLSCCWMFADQGKRYSLPNSRIMIHQPLGGAQGDQTDIDSQGPQRTGLSISGPMSLSSLWFSISSTFLYERLEFNFPDIISVKNITATEALRSLAICHYKLYLPP